MNFAEGIRLALFSLWTNRLRSLLTLLGIVIGVMSVIAVVSIIEGLNDYVAKRIFTLAPDVVTVSRMEPIIESVDQWVENARRKNLYLGDMEAVRLVCAHCTMLGASLNASGRVKYGRDYVSTSVQGYTSEVPIILGNELSAGRFLSQYDVDHARNVCVIGFDVADILFHFVDPIGKEVTIDGRPFEVVGVGKQQGSVLGRSRDNWVTIPISQHLKIWGNYRSVQIYAKAGTEQRLPLVEDEIRLVLRARRHVAYSAKDDFALSTSKSFLQIWANISQAFFAVTVGIAAISLLVGGIVVMNIMLVSVSERTREIGIRKALGARRRDILLQFLIESATLALVGGVIGVLLGAAVALTVASLTPLPASVKWWAVGLGLFVSTSVGLFFGIYPAKKAANLDPIEALRYE